MRHTNPLFGGYQLRENGLWLSDNTVGNVSTARHGFVPKLGGTTTKFLRDDGTFATPGVAAGLPYMYPFVEADSLDDLLNDNFRVGNGSGGMDTSGTRRSGATAWTSENIGTSTITMSGDGLLWLKSPASASIQIRGYYQAVPSGNWCIRMNLTHRPNTANTTEKAVGMYLRESGTGKIEWWAIAYSGGSPILWAAKLTNATTFSATRASTGVGNTNWPTFLEIEYNGTNYYFRYGWGDLPLVTFTSFAKANFFTTAADGIGLFSENDVSVANTLVTRGWYRVPTSTEF